ncbi:MAG: hypothetical protein AB1Z98_17845 [Nannocystaceae bacterium]
MMRNWVLGGALGLLGGLGVSCGGAGEDGTAGGGSCTPGQVVECPCLGGEVGVQSCDATGDFFGPCQCGGATGGEETDSDADTEANSGTGSGTSGASCGDGMEDPGECDMGGAAYCPQDCGSVDGGTMDDGTTGEDSCAGDPVYVAMVPSSGSRWESGALTGIAAGEQLCQQAAAAAGAADPMEVGVCEYQQVLQAAAAGEFAAMPAGTTAWLHRLTVADIGGVPTQPGVGGRCVDWTYQTNHISDGEFVEFGAGGLPTYNLDNDTFYDGVDTTHTQPGLLECGTAMRAILCCNPPCEPAG